MGQAKKRGTYDQRKALAIARDKKEKSLMKNKTRVTTVGGGYNAAVVMAIATGLTAPTPPHIHQTKPKGR